jgi:hypothetical protein
MDLYESLGVVELLGEDPAQLGVFHHVGAHERD